MPKHVIVDGNDGTITISKYLYKAILMLGLEKGNRVYMFKMADAYAFAINPEQLKDVDTNFYEVQYNYKEKTIGFMPTCPSVALLLNDYGLPHGYIGKLKVTTHKAKDIIYFVINK